MLKTPMSPQGQAPQSPMLEMSVLLLQISKLHVVLYLCSILSSFFGVEFQD